MLFSLLPGLLTLLPGHTEGHVSLMWPPARAPGLDFLDSFRTKGECGVEEPKGGPRTVLMSGSPVNVTWHLGYPHGGGYRVELTCPSTAETFQLLPSDPAVSWETEGARNSQSHQISLPKGVVCNDCYMRLERQATEWGQKYKFRSCADLRLVKAPEEEDCGEGRKGASGCECPRGRVGARCQYSTDCQEDGDCNSATGQGRCLVTDSAVFRIGQCFCTDGWQGSNCEIPSVWEEEGARSFDSQLYQAKCLSEGVKLLWRKIPEDRVDLVLSAPTDSWLGLGWRPVELTKSCQEFPSYLSQPRGKDFHGMDCTDMVLGAAREGLGRVGDHYTRDRSTPRLDKDYGGSSSLVASHSWEEDGFTWLRAIRQVEAGVADHPLQGQLHLIWAYGQQSDFYRPDQIKYHGRKNRGAAFLDMDQEEGPSTC